MHYLSRLTMCSPSQTKQKCRDHNKPSEKQIEDINSIETTINRAKNKWCENVETTITTIPSENVEITMKLILDKTTQLKLLKFRTVAITSPDLLNNSFSLLISKFSHFR